MFTTIMYGFINEVTRQPATAELPLRAERAGGRRRSAAGSPSKVRRVTPASGGGGQLSSKYRVLADSFKHAAGFH
jgi:hypothetical protein